MTGHPCETCLRWPECNGIDRDACPLVKAHAEKEAAPVRVSVAIRLDRFDGKKLAGLMEEVRRDFYGLAAKLRQDFYGKEEDTRQ